MKDDVEPTPEDWTSLDSWQVSWEVDREVWEDFTQHLCARVNGENIEIAVCNEVEPQTAGGATLIAYPTLLSLPLLANCSEALDHLLRNKDKILSFHRAEVKRTYEQNKEMSRRWRTGRNSS